MLPVALLLLASTQRVEIVNGPFEIPPGKWYQVGLGLRQGRPVVVSADFELHKGPHIRLEFLRREDLQQRLEGRPNSFLAMTAPGTSGRLRYVVRERGYYVVFLDNRQGTHTVTGHLRVEEDFGRRRTPEVSQLSPQRQTAVIIISFAVFFAIVTFSARHLLRAIRR
jgi:hypothetical protein